jgi:hypothetical protein
MLLSLWSDVSANTDGVVNIAVVTAVKKRSVTIFFTGYPHPQQRRADASSGFIIKLSANAIPMLIAYIMARGCSAANFIAFSRNVLNIVVPRRRELHK